MLDNTVQGKERAEKQLKIIESNTIDIERGTLRAGGISFQISNIASLEVENGHFTEGETHYWGGLIPAIVAFFIVTIIGDLIARGAGGLFGLLAAGAAFALGIRKDPSNSRPNELRLLTNAASSFRIIGSNYEFLLRLKAAIEDAMHSVDNSVVYHIDKLEQKIDRRSVSVTASGPGAIATGGDISGSTLTTNVTVQGLKDVTELMSIVDKVAGANASALNAQLAIIQQHLAGGAHSKADAKAAWQKFTENVGMIARAGANVFELVARISGIFG